MRILDKRVYVGPNLYANFKVIRFTLDLGLLEEWPSARIPGFTDALLRLIPSLDQHGCSFGEPGGFLRRLTEDEGTWMGHVMEHVAIELQNLAGSKVSFGKTRGSGQPGCYHMVYQYEDPWVGEQAGKLAFDLLHTLMPAELRGDWVGEPEFTFQAGLEKIIRGAQRRAFGPSTLSLVRAAEDRDIPWVRLNDQSLVQFGHGYRQKRIQATVTSETKHIAVEIAGDKEETNRILGDLGLPVPKQERVYEEEEAVEAANELGFPVVVKPLDANHGRGVSIGLVSVEQVKKAFHEAAEHSSCVLVETYLRGFDHRMLVVNGDLVAVAKRVPGHVVGDGRRTIRELVEFVNLDPRRGIGHEKVLTRLELDAQAERLMHAAGYNPESILAADEVLYLRSTANLSTGGTAVDVTDLVHPDNRDMAVRAVAAVGLDVCGVDFLTPDISRSWREVGGGICEVNAAPGFRMHVAPSEGKSRDVAGKVLDMLFPHEQPSRIPIAAITGTNGKTTTTRMLAHINKLDGKVVGMTTTDGVYIDGRLTVPGDMTGPIAARMVLTDPFVQVAVLETARGGLLRSGMGYRHPDVACCLNVSADHLGLGGIHTLEQLADVKRIPIEVARDTVVLNADDELCLRMADRAVARNICYATMRSDNPLVREHIRAGGRAVALEGGINGQMITLYDKGQHIPLLWTHLIPATLEGKALHNVQNAMFAAAMAWSMGVGLENIRHGLRTFDTTFFQAPGRMNIFDNHGFKVILDYGHNPAAVDAMCTLVDGLAASGVVREGGRKIVVLSAPGDRRDEDIRAVGARCARTFDHFILREDDDIRGRTQGEIARLLTEGLGDRSIDVVHDEQESIDHALKFCRPGDLLLVFCDNPTRAWKQIIYFGGKEKKAEPPPVPPPMVEEAEPVYDRALVRDERGVRVVIEEVSD